MVLIKKELPELKEYILKEAEYRKMNWIEEFKKGSGIHIKKKNRGSFTKYCKGHVTEECIQRGKHSKNPLTRKRANFAWVSRHKFKHEDGGEINYLDIFNT